MFDYKTYNKQSMNVKKKGKNMIMYLEVTSGVDKER